MITAPPLSSPLLSDAAGVRHAFFTRRGGVSEGRYASLNCGLGSADEAPRVARNRALAMGRLGLPAEALATAYQVHSARAVVLKGPRPDAARPEADALVTDRPGIALGILSADCAPVLLADARAGVIGAAHAGWRGALAGVVEAALAAMCALGAERGRIVAAIGPCIRQPSYEVGSGFRDAFLAADAESEERFRPAPRPGHFLFDLPGYVADRLSRAGLAAAFDVACDTCADPARFFSYRRTTLNGGGEYGRLLSAIAIGP